jgi:hypothetical protein
MPPWVEVSDPALMTATTFNLHNLRGQSLLFRCLETGFVTTAPALTRYQQGRGIDPSRRELVGERPEQWCRTRPGDDLRPLRCGNQGQPVVRPPTPAEPAL